MAEQKQRAVYVINVRVLPKDHEDFVNGKSVRLHFSSSDKDKLYVSHALYQRALKAYNSGRKYFRGSITKTLMEKNLEDGGSIFSSIWNGIKAGYNFLKNNKELTNKALDLASVVAPPQYQGAIQVGKAVKGLAGLGIDVIPEVEEKQVMAKPQKKVKRPQSEWVKYVKAYWTQHGGSYKDAMKHCATTWKKSGAGTRPI